MLKYSKPKIGIRPQPPYAGTVVKDTLAKHGIDIDKLRTAGRLRNHEVPRVRSAINELVDQKGQSFSQIGRLINKNHATIMYHYYADPPAENGTDGNVRDDKLQS